MRFRLHELAAAVDGVVELPEGGDSGDSRPDDVEISGVSIDSRSVEPGNLFVPLVAERDGHDFVANALSGGAGAYLTSVADVTLAEDQHLVPRVRVADTSDALMALGTLARSRLDGPVIGITGSVGKTSVKDLTRAACSDPQRPQAWASLKSFNNEIGVPLTLLNAPDDAAIVIVEMGSRGIGHIDLLCGIAKPTIGVVTTVALAHSELFGSIEGVTKGKGELIESLPSDGTAVLNADNPHVLSMVERSAAPVITFGVLGDGDSSRPQPDVAVGPISLDAQLHPTFTLVSRWGRKTVTLPVAGAHMALNAAAAVAAAVSAGVPFVQAAAQVANVELSPWRMEVASGADGTLVINDAYNANPTSMRAAIKTLTETGRRRMVAVVGEMAELGDEGPAEHLAIAAEAQDLGIEIVAVAAPGYGPAARHVDDIDSAVIAIGVAGAETAVLVKGSRVAELERLAERLLA